MKTFKLSLPDPRHNKPIGIQNLWSKFIGLISGEFLLNHRDNGGATIALRAMICSLAIFTIVISLLFILSPTNEASSYWIYIREGLVSKTTWFGAIFAAVYAALYARFASQWSYLANLYNQIKQASLGAINGDNGEIRLAEWKAGFIEDAEYLHLAHKENFVSIIHAWMSEKKVEEAYIEYTPGGEGRWQSLKQGIEKRYAEINENRERS